MERKDITKDDQKEHENTFLKYSQEVVRFLMFRYRWDREEAQTIFHDAYLLAKQHITEGKIKEVNIAYLKELSRKIGSNLLRKQTSKKNRFVFYTDEATDQLESKIYEHYGIQIFENETSRPSSTALRAFSMIDDKCQQLINMRYVDELGHRDIATRLDHLGSEKSSKTQLSRCLKYWKKLYRSLL